MYHDNLIRHFISLAMDSRNNKTLFKLRKYYKTIVRLHAKYTC